MRRNQTDYVHLTFQHGSSRLIIQARHVVLAIPPRLLIGRVSFTSALNHKLRQVMSNTETWMAGHAKAIIVSDHPFWRIEGFSGNVLCHYQGAILAEIFDACSKDIELAALAGFVALPAAMRQLYRQDLEARIVDQLIGLFGRAAAQPQEIIIQDWFTEAYTATAADESPSANHPHYGHQGLQLDHWNDKLYFCGTETAKDHDGYL